MAAAHRTTRPRYTSSAMRAPHRAPGLAAGSNQAPPAEGEGGRPGAPQAHRLGKHANRSAAPGRTPVDRAADEERAARARADRRARHDALDGWRRHSSLERVRKCGIVPRTADGVGFRFDGQKAGWSGVCHCGSVWACPVDAARIGAERAADIATVIRYVVDELGGSVLHVTLTARHHKGLTLAETTDAVTKAWAFVGRARWWKETLDQGYDRAGFVRALEVTYGRNGWHPHLHVLLFLGRKVDEMEALKIGARLREVYSTGLARHGFTCSDQGVFTRLATTMRDAETVLARYVTKIAHEITRGDRKQGKAGGLTPFELFAAAAETGDERLLAAAHEYERTMTGRRQLSWSGKRDRVEGSDIRTRAGLRQEERTDEEIAEEDQGAADLFYLAPDEWRRVRGHRLVLVETAETEGVAAVLDMLEASGVRYELPEERAHLAAMRAGVTSGRVHLG